MSNTCNNLTNPQPGPLNTSMTGSYYCYVGSGGYSMEKNFSNINRSVIDSSFALYDITNAVQILLDVKTLNERLGLIKDSMNQRIISTTYNSSTEKFSIDSISITAEQFQNGITNSSQILSVGSYSTIHNDFENYIKQYFSYNGNLSSLFASGTNDLNSNFDNNSLYELLKTSSVADANGKFVKKLSGTVTINNISSLLKQAVTTNLFNNRSPSGKSYTVCDSLNNTNWNVGDGFVKDDLIYIATGTEIVFNVNVLNETTVLKKTTTAPLLIRLVDSVSSTSCGCITPLPCNVPQPQPQHKNWLLVFCLQIGINIK